MKLATLSCERRHCSLYHLLVDPWSPTGRYSTLASSLRETSCCATSNLLLGVTNKGREANKLIFGAVARDSSLQDRKAAHYLLSLLFSLFSLPFRYYFCVPYQKYQKYLLPCLLLLLWVPLKTLSCVTSLVTTTKNLYALLLLHLPLQHLHMKSNLLCLILL